MSSASCPVRGILLWQPLQSNTGLELDISSINNGQGITGSEKQERIYGQSHVVLTDKKPSGH